MKKFFKIVLSILGVFVIVLSALFLLINFSVSNVKLDKNKFVSTSNTAVFYDILGNEILEQSNGVSVTPIEEIPLHTQNAFISIEDKRFFKHKGVDIKALIRATFNNVKTASFKEGGSTITQQLIKNTHLSGEKTLSRKFAEIKLALKLEKEYEKKDILEAYLNTIYFGDNCYGITSASKHYFDKIPSELNINESAVLAGIVKAPLYYSPLNDYEKSFSRKNLVLKQMFDQGYISENEYNFNKNQKIETINNSKNKYDYFNLAKNEFAKLISTSPYSNKNVKVYTNFTPKLQEILSKVLNDFNDYSFEKSIILMDKTSNILAYYSTCGDICRQVGSTIKPLGVYAPAIEENIVNSYSFINDAKTEFNGYSPSNYNDKYRGDISVRQALAVSSNVCAVKLLNSIGIDKSVETLNKMNFNLNKNDVGLSLALGCNVNGQKLSTLTSAYSVFLNNGRYTNASCINNFSNKIGVKLYENNKFSKQIFGEDTAYIVSDMLNFTVTDGTAKKLKELNGSYYAKTGTVGDKNGNTDAYCISFTSDYILGVWCGELNGYMDNSITGGSTPTQISADVWKSIYNNTTPQAIEKPNSVTETYIDKICYEEDSKIVLADDNAPERLKIKTIFKNSSIPKTKSNRFTMPKIENHETIVNNNIIEIRLCLPQYVNARVYREINGKKQLVFDTKNNGTNYIDNNLEYNTIYQYVLVPYFNNGEQEFLGEEVYLDKIKTPNVEFGDDWFDNVID